MTKHVFIAEFRGYVLKNQSIGRDGDLVFDVSLKICGKQNQEDRQTDQMNITPFFLNCL